MSSTAWRVLGADSILGNLRADLRDSEREIAIMGPWIDDYFADVVLRSCRRGVKLKVLTRPLGQMSEGFLEHAREARRRFAEQAGAVIKVAARLHAKVIILDERTVYCGSANWYRYSLEESQEIVLRGPVADVPGLLDEWEALWGQGDLEAPPRAREPVAATPTGYQEEVPDPIAAEVLERVPGSFVLRPKRRR
jgi:hypothetical protein